MDQLEYRQSRGRKRGIYAIDSRAGRGGHGRGRFGNRVDVEVADADADVATTQQGPNRMSMLLLVMNIKTTKRQPSRTVLDQMTVVDEMDAALAVVHMMEAAPLDSLGH